MIRLEVSNKRIVIKIKKKILAFGIIVASLLSSVLIVILPTFFSNTTSRIELKESLSLERVLEKTDIELLFFGYTGCLDICTPRLQDLATWYDKLPQKLQENITVSFIDLAVPKDKEVPTLFAQSFHPKFNAIFLPKNLLLTYTKALSVYFSPSLFNEGEIDHSAHLYVLAKGSKGKYLRFIYSAYPYDFKQITSDIKGLIHE